MKPNNTTAAVTAAFVCGTFLVAWTPVQASRWQPDVEAALGTNSNVGQAEKHRDIINDRFAVLTAGGTFHHDLDPQRSIGLRGFVETEQFQEVRGLSRLSAGGKFIFSGRVGAGPIVPSYQFNTMVRVDQYDHKQRDSTVVTAQLFVSQPFGPRLTATTGVEYRHRDSSGTVFDLTDQRWFLSGHYAFPPGWTVYSTYNFIYGDVWSTAQVRFCNGAQAPDIFGLISASDAKEPDDAFNSAFCGHWLAYRLKAHTNTLKLGVNKDLGHGMALDVSFLAVWVKANGDNNYNTRIFRASLLKRF